MTHVTHDPWVTGAVTPAQALHRFIDYPALYLDIVHVHTPLLCYIIAHVSKLLAVFIFDFEFHCKLFYKELNKIKVQDFI